MIELFPDNTINQTVIVKSSSATAVMPASPVFMQREEILLPSFQAKEKVNQSADKGQRRENTRTKVAHNTVSEVSNHRSKHATMKTSKRRKSARKNNRGREFKWLVIAMILCGMFFGMLISASIIAYGQWKNTITIDTVQDIVSDQGANISDLTHHEEQYKMITIQEGDSLWSIAREHMIPGYGSVEEMIQCIALYNHLEDSQIFAGQTLKIPYRYVNVSKGL